MADDQRTPTTEALLRFSAVREELRAYAAKNIPQAVTLPEDWDTDLAVSILERIEEVASS